MASLSATICVAEFSTALFSLSCYRGSIIVTGGTTKLQLPDGMFIHLCLMTNQNIVNT